MSWRDSRWDHIGQGCDQCAAATGKEELCAIGRAEYDEYLRSLGGNREGENADAGEPNITAG